MSSEALHAPRERLTRETLHSHHAIVSLKEELDAVDWYRQRAEDCDDPELKEILLHNMREEIEHACMALEWLRRADADWAGMLETYLFTQGPVTEVEEAATGEGAGEAAGGEGDDTGPARSYTVGPMKGE